VAGWTCHTTPTAPRHVRPEAQGRLLELHASALGKRLETGARAGKPPVPALERRGETGARGRMGQTPGSGVRRRAHTRAGGSPAPPCH